MMVRSGPSPGSGCAEPPARPIVTSPSQPNTPAPPTAPGADPDCATTGTVLYVEDDNIVTSAGTAAAIDCCLNLVRQRDGADVANRVARMLVTPPHRQGGQAQFIEQPVPELPSESRLPGVLEWALEHLAEPLSVDVLADAAHMSRRNFTRRFREATGTTVARWVVNARLARAQQLLETTYLPVERIATEVGFRAALSLRQNFSELFGTTPSAYRRTFSSRPFAA